MMRVFSPPGTPCLDVGAPVAPCWSVACDLSEKPHYLAGSESDAHLMARCWLPAKTETQRPLPSGGGWGG